jgi:membrane protease YdiL (CAAX protease family)
MGWVVISVLVSGLAGLILGFFAGVVLAATGLNGRLGPADTTAIYAFIGLLSSAIVLSWIALTKGAQFGNGDARAGVGDRPIAHPVVVALICTILVAYAAAITFGVLKANHAALRNFLSASAWIACVNFVMIVVAAPLAEELFFRGWLWSELQARWRALPVAVVTSATWLALHLPEGVGRVTLLLPIAIALPLVRHFGRSVRAPIIAHVCNNVAASATPWLSLWFGWLAIP